MKLIAPHAPTHHTMLRQRSDGFSLLELVVAVSITLIIAVVAFIAYQGFTDNARQASVERAASDVFTAAMAEDANVSTATLPASLQSLEDEYNESTGEDLAVEIEYDDPDITVTARGWDGRYIATRSTSTALDGHTSQPGDDTPSDTPGDDDQFTGDIHDYDGVFQFTVSEPGVLDLYNIADGTTITHNGETTELIDATPDWEADLQDMLGGAENWRSLVEKEYGPEWEGRVKEAFDIRGTPIELPSAGEYTIEGAFEGIGSYSVQSVISKVSVWENTGTTDASFAFANNENNIVFEDTPPGTIEDMYAMFYFAQSFNDDIGEWDTSNVEIMYGMFFGATSFNQDLSSWDTSSTITMQMMFRSAVSFDQDISDWNMSNVQHATSMFSWATSYNNGGEPLDWEDTSSITRMSGMFNKAESFNQDVSHFHISDTTEIDRMFQEATAFNNGGEPLLDWMIAAGA